MNVEFDFLPSIGKSFTCHIWSGAYAVVDVRFWGEKDFYFPMIIDTWGIGSHSEGTYSIEGRYFENPKEGKIVIHTETAEKINCSV